MVRGTFPFDGRLSVIQSHYPVKESDAHVALPYEDTLGLIREPDFRKIEDGFTFPALKIQDNEDNGFARPTGNEHDLPLIKQTVLVLGSGHPFGLGRKLIRFNGGIPSDNQISIFQFGHRDLENDPFGGVAEIGIVAGRNEFRPGRNVDRELDRLDQGDKEVALMLSDPVNQCSGITVGFISGRYVNQRKDILGIIVFGSETHRIAMTIGDKASFRGRNSQGLD